MLEIYGVALEVCRQVADVASAVERRDSDLGRQLRRAVVSVSLNIAEGSYSQGRNRGARYFNALGSARETLACLEVAEAMRYIDGVDEALVGRLRRIIGTLMKLVPRMR